MVATLSKGEFILGSLQESDVQWLRMTGQTQIYQPGTVLIQESTILDTFYIVLKGRLSVSVSSAPGREIAQLGNGEILGEMSFIDSNFAAATVSVLEDSLLLSLPQKVLAQKLETDEGFASRFYRAIAKFLSTRLRTTVIQFGYDERLELSN